MPAQPLPLSELGLPVPHPPPRMQLQNILSSPLEVDEKEQIHPTHLREDCGVVREGDRGDEGEAGRGEGLVEGYELCAA